MGSLFEGNELEDIFPREGNNGVEGNKEDSKEDDKEREARQRDSDKRQVRGRKTKEATTEAEQSEELPRLVVIEDEEQPEQLVLDIKDDKSKKKKKAKKSENKMKDKIKLGLVGIYGLLGATLDECFFLTPNEANLLTEAVYRYLDEHDLLTKFSEKSATLNLLIALTTVNTPKIITYYMKVKKRMEEKRNEKGRKTQDDSRQGTNRSAGRQHDDSNAKTYLDKFYQSNEG